MGTRMKEDEKIERVIRGLLKLPDNRRCINCNSLGPQYVCTTFWTFVCTNCSGIHREFTHRVKSVSMAKFTKDEFSCLQAGGNERARQLYFKEFNPQRHSLPDSSNLHKLRNFIKHVYVDRQYTGDRSIGALSMVKLGEKEDLHENMFGIYSGGARSPRCEQTYELHHSESNSSYNRRHEEKKVQYHHDEIRSPRFSQERSRYRKSPVSFEVVDDRFRDDGIGNGGKSQSRRFPNGEFNFRMKLPTHSKNLEISSPSVICNIKNYLGDKVQSLRVSEISKAKEEEADSAANTQPGQLQNATSLVGYPYQSLHHGVPVGYPIEKKLASSSSAESVDKNQPEHKRANSKSLIDLSTDPDPPNATGASESIQVDQPNNGDTLASFELSSKEKTSNLLNAANTLEYLLSELSVPSVLPIGDLLKGFSSGGATPVVPPVAPILPVTGSDSIEVTDMKQLIDVQPHQLSRSPLTDGGAAAPSTTLLVGVAGDQPLCSQVAQKAQKFNTAASQQIFETDSKYHEEPKPSGRKELPADLFTASYLSGVAQAEGWHSVPLHGMGYSMQHQPTTMLAPAFVNPAKSTNPFDFSDGATHLQAHTIIPMIPKQGAVQNVIAPTALPRSSSLNTHSPSYAATMLPLSPYTTAFSPRGYMEQYVQNNLPPSRLQGNDSFSSRETAYDAINMNHPPTNKYSAPTIPNSFSSMGGNPFE